MAWIKRTWQESGTKVIGYFTAALGVLGTLDANTLQLVGKLFGPKIGDKFGLVCLIISGGLTAFRGHKNTADIAKQMVEKASTGEVVASAQVVTAAAKTAVAADDKASSETDSVVTSTPPTAKGKRK